MTNCKKKTVFIYACPSSSPIKHRMLYSSGAIGVFASAKTILGPESSSVLASKKIETSDPKEIDEAFIRAELGVEESAPGSGAGTPSLRDDEKKPFARPKGPGRRR
jgi:twinfilin-like protein